MEQKQRLRTVPVFLTMDAAYGTVTSARRHRGLQSLGYTRVRRRFDEPAS